MKTLYLLRHAKSDWSGGETDHERGLTRRGVDAAQRMGRLLAGVRQVPERVVSSTAKRAHLTATLAADAGGWNRQVETDGALYETGPEEMLGWLRQLDETTTSILLVGHEPTWSMLAEGLVGGGELRFPTAALARIDLHVERWSDTDFGHGELHWLLIPRLLKTLGWPPDL